MGDTNTSATNRESTVTTNNYYAYNGKLMLISLIVLVSICTIICFFHSYARWARCRRRSNRELHRGWGPRADDHLVFNFGPTTSSSTHRKGLDRSVIRSLPTFLYDSETHDPRLECAVCLSEFGHNELGRVLPKCNHCFHIDCIDMWFHSHSNCPLCRAPVKPLGHPVETKTPAGETSGSGLVGQREDGQDGGSTSSVRKPVELVGVTVEVPKTNPSDFGEPKEVGYGEGV